MPNLTTNFMKGANFPILYDVEANGGEFSDEMATIDPVSLLEAHGRNWARLRRWNDPYDASWMGDDGSEPEYGSTPGPVGGRTNDLKTFATQQKIRGLASLANEKTYKLFRKNMNAVGRKTPGGCLKNKS